ncbi:MAG: hypothetical protein HQK63_01355 [Desulfamplus sp.]|nr:hypothetical protein [Desulfamplus sp.]
MTKPIKFNLILDGKPIRDITGLEENFNIDDLLEHYKSGVLQRWLKIRQHSDLLAKVEAITEKDDLKIAESLVNIFGISLNKQEIGDAVYPIIFRRTKENQLKEYEKNSLMEKAVINKYHEDYRSLCEGLKKSKTDYSFVKHSLKKMESEFFGLYEMNYSALFLDLIKESPLSVFGILAADKKQQSLRSLFLSNSQIKTSIKDYVDKTLVFWVNEQVKNEEPKIDDISMDEVKRKIPILIDEFKEKGKIEDFSLYCCDTKHNNNIYFPSGDPIVIIAATPNSISTNTPIAVRIIKNKEELSDNMIKYFFGHVIHYTTIDSIKHAIVKKRTALSQKKVKQPKANATIPKDLPPYIKTFSGHTESYWKDIESAGKQYMVIYMQEGNFVRNMGKKGEELSADDVNGSFPILNGIDYKSNNDSHSLYYMEI